MGDAAEPEDTNGQAYADIDQLLPEPASLSLLDSLDEALQQLKNINIEFFGRPEILPDICAVYDALRLIIGDLRRVCWQQLRNSQDIVDLLARLAAEREANDEQRLLPGAGITAAVHKHEDRVPEAAGCEPMPSSRLCDSGKSQEEDRNLSAMRSENNDLRSQLLYARVQLQSEIDARQTAEQHLHIMKQKDVLRRIALQEETDKVRVKDDHIRILEMVIQGLRQTSAFS